MYVKKQNRFEKKREIMKNKLLLGAITAFYEKGYHSTRVKDITDHAGTAVGNFYHYFESKEQIFNVLIDRLFKILLHKLKKVSEMNLIPRISNLENLLKEYLILFNNKEQSQIALLFIEQMGGINPIFLEKKKALLKSFEKEINKIISRLLETGFIRDQNSDLTSHIWQVVVTESFAWWINSEKKISEEELIKNVLDFLIKGTVSK